MHHNIESIAIPDVLKHSLICGESSPPGWPHSVVGTAVAIDRYDISHLMIRIAYIIRERQVSVGMDPVAAKMAHPFFEEVCSESRFSPNPARVYQKWIVEMKIRESLFPVFDRFASFYIFFGWNDEIGGDVTTGAREIAG